LVNKRAENAKRLLQKLRFGIFSEVDHTVRLTQEQSSF